MRIVLFRLGDLIVNGQPAGLPVKISIECDILDVRFYRTCISSIKPDEDFFASDPACESFQQEPRNCVLPSTGHLAYYPSTHPYAAHRGAEPIIRDNERLARRFSAEQVNELMPLIQPLLPKAL
jgi:hypothetical protein